MRADLQSPKAAFHVRGGDGPVVAVALHGGHSVRAEIERTLELTAPERRREEDPFTDRWTSIGDWAIVALRSRFEVDLNRPRHAAVYTRPEHAWGLQVWKHPPDSGMIRRSLEVYDSFYDALERLFRRLERTHGRFLVIDLHSYNHRRDGPRAPPADPGENPEVNIGTGTLDSRRWARERTTFMGALRAYDFGGRRLDVRENVRFQGGHLAAWVHGRFPTTGCVLAVEVKKFFMDEWTGRVDPGAFARIEEALRQGTSALRQAWQSA